MEALRRAPQRMPFMNLSPEPASSRSWQAASQEASGAFSAMGSPKAPWRSPCSGPCRAWWGKTLGAQRSMASLLLWPHAPSSNYKPSRGRSHTCPLAASPAEGTGDGKCQVSVTESQEPPFLQGNLASRDPDSTKAGTGSKGFAGNGLRGFLVALAGNMPATPIPMVDFLRKPSQAQGLSLKPLCSEGLGDTGPRKRRGYTEYGGGDDLG